MSQRRIALLPDRAVVQVDGGDAEKFLQQLVTNDVELGASRGSVFAALLTPQGKVLFDFFVMRHGGSYMLDTAASKAAELVKRLQMYRLRARVDITDQSDRYVVEAVWNDSSEDLGYAAATPHALDPRLHALGMRDLRGPGAASDLKQEAAREANASAADYHAHRIALGVPEGGTDYAFGDTFPHEANFDLLNGVSFTKGCFIGQEVVSRMQHRGTARKRIVIVQGEAPLQAGAQITAGTATIGTVGSVAGSRGLALLRLDRAQEAKAKGDALAADGIDIAVHLPAYLKPPGPVTAS